MFSPSRSPHPLVQARKEKKRKEASMYFYLLKSKCLGTRLFPHHHTIFTRWSSSFQEKKRSRSARCGTRTLASAGTPPPPERRSSEPDLVWSPLVTRRPSVHPQKTGEHQSSLSIASPAENKPKRVCFLLTPLSYFIVYTPEKILGTTVRTADVTFLSIKHSETPPPPPPPPPPCQKESSCDTQGSLFIPEHSGSAGFLVFFSF